MLKTTIAVLLAVAVALSVQGMIETLALPELVKKADFIVIAKVADKAPSKDGLIKNTLTTERALKGEWATDKPVEINTVDTKGERVEDVVVLPEVGQRVVLFLKKKDDGTVRAVNGIQGVWPLEEKTDKTLSMGLGYSLAQIEAEVKGGK